LSDRRLSFEERSALRGLVSDRRKAALALLDAAKAPTSHEDEARAGVKRFVGAWLPAEGWSGCALSVRERQVVELRSRGASNAEIAEALGISYHTASRHLSNARKKLGVSAKSTFVFASASCSS